MMMFTQIILVSLFETVSENVCTLCWEANVKIIFTPFVYAYI